MQVRTFRHAAGGYVASHSHAEGQLFVIAEGTCTLRTGDGEWLVTSERPCWIPPHRDHAVATRGLVTGVSILLDEQDCDGLPARAGVLRSHRLLIAVVNRLAGRSGDHGREAHLCAVLVDEIVASRWDELSLPMPQQPSLRAVASAIVRDPADARTLDEWSRSSALSKRTFTRRFQAETGLSFGAWRRRARLAQALDLLAAGRSVTDVALDVGYGSVSSFSVMFTAAIGTPPRGFMRIVSQDGRASHHGARLPLL